MPNIEIKSRYPDLDKARKISERLGARKLPYEHQTDTYFRVPAGRLKLRESSIHGAQLIPYLRGDVKGPKLSDYALVSIADSSRVKSLLSAILGVEAVVDKQREIYLVQNVRVHLDRVEGLGTFLEFEAVFKEADPTIERQEQKKVERLMMDFEIVAADLVPGSYRELVSGMGQQAEQANVLGDTHWKGR